MRLNAAPSAPLTPAQRAARQRGAANLRLRRIQKQITQLKARDRALAQKMRILTRAPVQSAADYSTPYYPQAQPQAPQYYAPDYSAPYYPQGEGFAPTQYDEGMDYSGDAAAKLFEAFAERGEDGGADGEQYYEYETDLGTVRRAPALAIAGVPAMPVALGVAALVALFFVMRKPRRGRK